MITLLFLAFAGVFKAIADVLLFHFDKSIFKHLPAKNWNALLSWKNKYKNGNEDEGEAFLGSTTIFVVFTDWWHRFDLARIICAVLAAAFAPVWSWWIVAVLGLVIYLGVFTIVYYSLYER